MKKDERGFAYPLTLVVLLLFLLIFSYRVEQLLTERKLANETEKILQEEYYFHSSVKKLEKIYQTDETIPLKGTFSFSNGVIEYQAEASIGSSQTVSFRLMMKTGETLICRGFFDNKTKKLVKWTELK
jgi:ComG operon protein 7